MLNIEAEALNFIFLCCYKLVADLEALECEICASVEL